MKTSSSGLKAQSPNKARLLAEKGGRIFARVRYRIEGNFRGGQIIRGFHG